MVKNTVSQRQRIRNVLRMTRNALTDAEQNKSASLLLERLISHPKVITAKRLSVTLAHNGEINTLAFIHWCWQQNKAVYLPVVDPMQTNALLFLEYQENTKLIKNHYGIWEPELTSTTKSLNVIDNTCPINELDIVFVPLVAFDHQGNRIGMGGGYYDRLLSPWHKQKKGPYPIGLAHDCQCIDNIIAEPWDVPLPEIITPNQHFSF